MNWFVGAGILGVLFANLFIAIRQGKVKSAKETVESAEETIDLQARQIAALDREVTSLTTIAGERKNLLDSAQRQQEQLTTRVDELTKLVMLEKVPDGLVTFGKQLAEDGNAELHKVRDVILQTVMDQATEIHEAVSAMTAIAEHVRTLVEGMNGKGDVA